MGVAEADVWVSSSAKERSLFLSARLSFRPLTSGVLEDLDFQTLDTFPGAAGSLLEAHFPQLQRTQTWGGSEVLGRQGAPCPRRGGPGPSDRGTAAGLPVPDAHPGEGLVTLVFISPPLALSPSLSQLGALSPDPTGGLEVRREGRVRARPGSEFRRTD